MHHSQEEINSATKEREPSDIRTTNGFDPVRLSPSVSFARTSAPNSDAVSTLSVPLINPKHPPEICPPSPYSSKRDKWQKLKEENEARKNREVTRISYSEAAARTGRDQRGFKIEEGDGSIQKQKDTGAKWLLLCAIM